MVILISLKTIYRKSLQKVVDNTSAETFLPDIDRIMLKYKHLGLTKEQQMKILEQLSIAIDVKISRLAQEIREEDDN